MTNEAFELGEEVKLKEVVFKLHQTMWAMYDFAEPNLHLANWVTIKYLNDTGTGFHPDIDQLPNDKGGLYLFTINCPIIPGVTEFPAYIGRAQLTKNQNLRKRCREYFNKFSRQEERPKISKLFKYWANDIYLSFIELEENEDIIDLERKLINSLLLPFNDEIPEKEIRDAVKAF